MIGQNQIIAVRKQGFKPAAIFIEVGLTMPVVRYRFQDPEKQLEIGALPTVHLTLDELHAPLDLRFVAGCRVHVRARAMSEEVLRFADKVVAACARHVIVCCLDAHDILEYNDGAWRVL